MIDRVDVRFTSCKKKQKNALFSARKSNDNAHKQTTTTQTQVLSLRICTNIPSVYLDLLFCRTRLQRKRFVRLRLGNCRDMYTSMYGECVSIIHIYHRVILERVTTLMCMLIVRVCLFDIISSPTRSFWKAN